MKKINKIEITLPEEIFKKFQILEQNYELFNLNYNIILNKDISAIIEDEYDLRDPKRNP